MGRTDARYVAVSVVLAVAAWQALSSYVFNPTVFPPPLVVAAAFIEMLQSGELWVHLYHSLARILVGYAVGTTLGIAVGLVMGRIVAVRTFLDPLIAFVRSIPPVAMIPVAIVWFGIYEASKLFIILYTALIIVALNTMAGVTAVPVIRMRAAACLGAGPWRSFNRVMLPSAWPYILTGMRVALGFCFMSVVAAEIIAAESGLGYLIMSSRLMIQTQRMYVGLIVLGLLGVLTDRVFRYLVAVAMRRYMVEFKGIA